MKNNNEDQEFWVFVCVSIALHLAVFVLCTFGLPSLFKAIPEPQIITFDVLPVSDISNVKTQKIQQEKETLEEIAKKVQKSQAKEENAESNKKTEHEETKEESKRDPEEKKPENKQDVVDIKQKDSKKIEEKKKSDKAQEKQTKDSKDKPKPKKRKIATEKDIDALLKTLEKASDGKEAKSNKRAVSPKSDAKETSLGANYNEDRPLSISEEQSIRQQISQHWNVPAGVSNAGEITITIYIAMSLDGTVEQAKIVDMQCGATSMVCKAASDSALRAVRQASPLQNLMPERYESWKSFNISFDPREILGM
jgi:outer membrane biosynthesis protein TonB